MSDTNFEYSPTHWANPGIPVCYWCGREKDEIINFGKINENDDKAPKHVFIDYTPCNTCQHVMSQGIAIFGLSKTPIIENQLRITNKNGIDLYPLNSFLVVTEGFVEKTIDNKDMQKVILEKRKYFMPISEFEKLANEIEEKVGEDNGKTR